MPPGPPKLPIVKLLANPLEPLRGIVREGRERIEKAGSDIRSIAEEFRSTIPDMTTTIQSTEKVPQIEPQSRTSGSITGTSKLTSEETLAYQNREIGRELWLLEKHLAQGCRIPDKTGKPIPCDCCEKGSFIAGLAYESIPIAERGGKPSAIYEKIARWAQETEPMLTVPAVETGRYDYKKLAGQASALRKELMGTTVLTAMIAPEEQISLQDAKKMAAEEAAKEVEARWKKEKSTT